jgi:hypothetical protein
MQLTQLYNIGVLAGGPLSVWKGSDTNFVCFEKTMK